MTDKLRGAIGFSMKAGKCSSGEFAADKAFTSRHAKLVLLDERASLATRDRWKRRCQIPKVPYLEVMGIGEAIGKENRMVAAIVDDGFAAMIIKAANSDLTHNGGAMND